MNLDRDDLREVTELVHQLCNGELTATDMARLDQYLAQSDAAVQCYIEYLDSESQLLCQSSVMLGLPDATIADTVAPDESSDASVRIPSSARNPYEPLHSPVSGFLGGTLHDTVGHFASGWSAAYLAATVIVAVGLLIAAVVHVSHPEQQKPFAYESSDTRSLIAGSPSVVARITGMVDCVWEGAGRSSLPSPFGREAGGDGGAQSLPSPARGRGAGGEGSRESDSPLSTLHSPLVSLGDRLALKAGLLELTYDTGAKVILQGPVTYEVDSPSGGYLSIGKLTAKLEKKSEGRGERGERIASLPSPSGRGAGGEGGGNHKSPDLCPLTSDLFAIRTPTALVTDLGTEFGIEVDKRGITATHVYRGSVRLQITSNNGNTEGTTKVLHENESARVENRDKQGDNRIVMLRSDVRLADFVRSIPKQGIKTLDVVDIVAGGDGFSRRRNRGINPSNGRVTNTEVLDNPTYSDGKYHLVDALPFVDGVFIPNGANGPVQLDSAGHVFADCPITDNKTCESLWAGRSGSDSATLDNTSYASDDHGVLVVNANKGITFDLIAIRKANPGYAPQQFRAVTGNTEHVSEKGEPVYADVWVFVDGQVRWRRREINRYNGAMRVVVPIGDNDRFLTLVATDGGNGYQQDHIIFGDPQLELLPTKATADAVATREAAEH